MIGVIASLFFSIKALREVQNDRRQRQKPHLAFERGGYRYSIKYLKTGMRIPGVNPQVVEKLFANLPDDAESIRLNFNDDDDDEVKRVGKLKNYGLGPSLESRVTWNPKIIWFGIEEIELNDKKLAEPLYATPLNTMPAMPAHIVPNELSGLTRLPTFIEKDFERKISRVNGTLMIMCRDVFGTAFVTEQEFDIFMSHELNKNYFHVTFGDIL